MHNLTNKMYQENFNVTFGQTPDIKKKMFFYQPAVKVYKILLDISTSRSNVIFFC